MKKKVLLIVAVLCMMLGLIGCSAGFTKAKSFTYKVDTGDEIKIELNTKNKYDISSKVPFEISVDGETQTTGQFGYEEGFENYKQLIDGDDTSTIIDSGTKNGNKYIFWNYNDEEYDIVVKVKKSDTIVILCNTVSEESAKKVFDRLTITKD